MKISVALMLVLSVIACAPNYGAQAKEKYVGGVGFEKDFITALITRDIRTLSSFDVQGGGGVIDGSGFNPSFESFVYGSGKDLQSYRLLDIVGIDPYFETVHQPDGSVIVFYVKNNKLDSLRNENFMDSKWMIDYFACQFVPLDNGSWVLGGSLCFDETDGPASAN